MAIVQLTGDFSEAVTPAGTEVADTRSITLRLLSTIVLDNGDVHSPARWIITLTAGAFSRYLVVPDDATVAARYALATPDGAETVFTLASGDGPSITVAEVLLLNQVTISPNAVAALLAIYTPLATYTPAIAALGAADVALQNNINQEVDDRETADLLLQPIATLSEAIDDRVAALLVAGTNITLTYNDAAGTLTIVAAGGGGGSVVYGAWVDATLINGWVGFAAVKPGYRLVTVNGTNYYVELRGEATLAPPGSSVMFVLPDTPVNYRPSWRQVAAAGSNSGASVLLIGTDGTVLLLSGGTAPVELSNIRILLV